MLTSAALKPGVNRPNRPDPVNSPALPAPADPRARATYPPTAFHMFHDGGKPRKSGLFSATRCATTVSQRFHTRCTALRISPTLLHRISHWVSHRASPADKTAPAPYTTAGRARLCTVSALPPSRWRATSHRCG